MGIAVGFISSQCQGLRWPKFENGMGGAYAQAVWLGGKDPAPPIGCISHTTSCGETGVRAAHTLSLCLCLDLGLPPVTPPSLLRVSSLDL